MKKYLLFFIAIVVLGAGSYFTERQFLSYSNSIAPSSPAPAPIKTEVSPLEKLSAQKTTTKISPEPSTKSAVQAVGVNFTLSVDGQIYHGLASEGSTALDAMNTLASTTNFRFTSKNFPGMGAFVESINGKQAANEYNWSFYVNGTQAQQGISSTIVRSGDSIEWKYER